MNLTPITEDEERAAQQWWKDNGLTPVQCWGSDDCPHFANWGFFSGEYEGLFCRHHFNALLKTFN